tara:strand:- start:449 stop:730 length:282 start_codon:yes stop_codon:yes gene_type:complete
LSRTDLIKQLKRKNSKLNHSEIEIVIKSFSKSVSYALKEGRNVEIRGFGSFVCKKLKESWNLRNPSTNEIIYKPKRNKVKFKPAKNLLKLINK